MNKRSGHRGNLSCRRTCVWLLFTTILFLWNALPAHAQYVQRQVVTRNGAVAFVGNALGLNKDGTNDRPGTSGSLGTFITTDTSQRDNPEWPQGTTGDWRLNSSSAVLSLPSGSRIIHAELIWGGSYLFGSEDVSDFLNDPINFTTPTGTTQVTRDPTTAVTRSGPQQNSYVRTANVTALVSAAGSGTYTVGRVPATQATDEANFNSAGWTLAILYENAGLPTRSLSLFLGLEPQGGATASVSGICTPDNNGKLRARVAVSASGGDTPDPGNTRDSLRFGPSSNLSQDNFRLSGPNNPAENFFASQINRDDGELDTRGTFGDRNNDFKGTFAGGRQGWDITNVDASPELTRHQQAAFAQGTADGDDFFITALAMQIDVVAPAFGAEGATSVNNPTAQVGDVLTYTVELDNRSGAADANGVVLSVPLPAGMSFVAGSFRLDGTATGANPITGAAIGTVAQKTRREATFQLRVDSIPVAPAPARYQVTPTWTYTFVGCSGQTPQPGSSTSNTVTTEIARITAAKSASTPSIRPEEILTYTIAVLNSGTAASHDTLVTDAIPTGTTYRPNTTTLNGVAVADQLGTSPLVVGMLVNSAAVALGKPPSSSPGVIGPGQSATVSFQVIVNSSTTAPVVNTATIEPDGINGPLPAFPVSVTTPVNLSSADVAVSMAGPVTATAGTNINYSVTVQNNGPSAATAVSLFNTVPPGLTLVSVTGACSALPCSLGSMANDDTRTVSVTYAIPVNYSGADPIVNRASVTTAAEDIFPNNNSASVSTALRASVADLAITNTNGVSSVSVGTTTTYTITVTNAGPATAADAVVTDIFPSALTGVSWSCAGAGGAVCGAAAGTGNINATVTVPVTGAATFTATGTVGPASSDTIENTARVVPAAGTSDPTQAIATDIDPIELRADLSVTETGPATVVAGNHITYTLTVHNAGPSPDENVLLEELVPLELTFVSATGPCTAFPCSLGTLAAGATVSAQATYAVPASYLSDTVVSGARVSSSTVDPNEGNNTSTTTATVDRNADVEIIKQISPDTTSLLGEDATFFVTVTNHGPAPATGVVVGDLLPAGLTLVSAHVSQGSYVPQTGQWTVGTLEDEAFATLTLIATLTVVDSITNSAQVLRQIEPDPVPSNNFSAAVLNGQENADVGVNITVDKPAPLVGENVTFTVAVQNRGPSPATGLVVTDVLSAGLTLVTATPSQGTVVGPAWTIGALSEIAPPVTLTIIATVTAPGPVVNAAIITQQAEGDSNPVNNRASVALNAAESANLKVVKTLTRSTPHVGELLTFNVSVANQGPSPATGVAVTEVLSAGLAFELATPSQGSYDSATGIWTVGSIGNAGSAGLSLTVRVTQAGTVTNTASVTGDQPDPDLADNTSSVTLTTETIADLAIAKTLTGSAIPGLATTYTIVVTNLGPSPVTAASVSDLFPVALVAPAWTCVADAGSSCAAASGTGNLATTVTLEAGDHATFTVTGLIASSALGSLDNTATVAAPAGATDPVPANNTATSSVLLAPSAALQITKAGPTSAVAGTSLVYTIAVTNAGPSDAANVTLADPTPAGLTFVSNTGVCATAFPCNLGTLAPGATSTVTATFAIPSGYTTPNPIANTATVSSPTPPASSTSATTNTPLAVPVTDLHITKTNGADGVIAGRPTTYTIAVTNPLGPSDAIGATVTDTFPLALTGVTWTCTATAGGACPASGSGHINTSVTVPVGASVVFTATGTVNPAATGELSNAAQVFPPLGLTNRTSAIATDHDAIDTEADVAITKTGPASIVAGNPLVYTITVTNTGPSDATNVVVRDPTPLGLTWVSTAADCTTAFPCTLGVVPTGATRTITATFSVPLDYSGASPIANVTDVSSPTFDTNTTNNTATVETTLNRNSDVAISKSVSPAAVLVGQPTTFTVVVTNHGPARVTGLVVQDLLPAGLSLVLASASQGSYADATGAWTIGSLLNAQAATLTLDATVTVAGAITNRALVVARDQPDPVASNNSAAAVVNGTANADVGVNTAVDQPAPSVGDAVTFTVTVSNSGPSPATGVVVTDTLPAGLTLVSPTPSQGTYIAPNWSVGTLSETGTPATLTLVATVTASGALVQTATVTQQAEVDANGANNSASVTLNAAESANLTVTKSLTRSSPHVGELLTFNVIVANQGPSPATGVQVTEMLSAGLAFELAEQSQGAYDSATGLWTIGSLANGGSAGLTITARVTQAGTVTNTASVTARDQPDPDLTDNTASVTVATETIADLAVTKILTGPAIPGLATTYSIVVTNLGPSPVTAASVTDVFPLALVAPAWTCTADAGSSCAAALGTGNLATTVTLEAGDRATFLVTGLIAANATGQLVNTATVAAPAGAVDPDTANNTATSSVALAPSADLRITKAGPAAAVAGTNVVYTITATNAGPSDATGVTLSDPTPPGLTFVANAGDCTTAFPCDLGTLPPTATRTITATFSVPSGYTAPSPIVNTATVSSLTPDAAAGNNSGTTATPVAAPVTDLHITNSNGVNGVVAGLPTTYTLTVTNPLGPSDASGATVTDTFPAELTNVTWSCAGAGGGTCVASGSGNINTSVTVPVGATVVFTATGTVNPAATGDLVNAAQVIPPLGYSNRTSATATDVDAISSRADLGITKTGPAAIVAGNPLVFTITVTNTGPSDAAGVVVTDTTPTGLVFVSNTGACTTAFPCALGVVSAGATRTITATFTVPITYPGLGPIVNVASVSSTTPDDTATNNTATVETTLNRNADVAISKSVSPAAVLVGQPTTFTVVVTNQGPARVTGLVVQDLLPAGLSFVSASPSQGSYADATGAWTIGTLLNAQSATLTLTATVTVAGAITNRALVVARDQPDPVASNNSAAAVVNGAANADVGVHTAVDQPAPSVGDTVTFTVTVTNSGPSPATGVVVTDALPAGLTFVSATPSQGTYAAPAWTVGTLSETGAAATATLTIVATVTAPGALVHTATVTAQTEVDPNAANNSASVTLNSAESANLRVTKALTRSSPHVGELLTFNVIVTNQGPSPATGVQVTEVLSAGLAFESAAPSQGAYDAATGVWTVGSLGNGGSAGLTITARVTQAGTVTNTASVTARDQPDPDLTDNTATVTLTTETIADLAITKTLTGTAIPGLATTYTIVVTNTGPSPVTGASVTDLFPGALVAPAWTCTADPGSSCAAASGAGNLATTVTLEAGDRATFLVTGLIAANATGQLVNTATVAAPAGAVDGDATNNTATSTVTLTPSADVQVTKSGPATAVAGTNVAYTITVTNAGPSDATSVTLADLTPPGLTFVSNAGGCATAFPCNLGTLPPAATRTITATFAIPSGYTTPDPIENTATVSSTTPDAAAGNNSATSTTSLGTAVTDLHITKTNGVDGVVAGLPTTYTITVANPLGPSDASGATVIDSFPATLTGVTWTCAGTGGGTCVAAGTGNINTSVTVPVGATVVITATGTVNPAATGVLVNSAQALPPAGHANRTSAIATDSDAITSRADLGITKTGPVSIVAGNPVVFTITVTNTGPSDAAGVVVTDTTPTGLVFVSNTGACTTAFPCALGVVPAGATRTITATFSVPVTYPGLGPIVNVASVSATTPDDTAANNTATVETTLNRNADVAISKSVSPAAVLVGQPTTFTVVVTNQGPARVTGLVVQDLLPAGLSFVSASPSQGSYADATGAWTIGTLQNAASATLTLQATVTVAGAITNRALVVARDQPDPVASNNSAAAIVNGAANADVGMHTAVDQPAPSVGDTVTFTVTMTNSGPSPATGVVVTDALPAGLTFVSATPSQGTYAAPAWTVGTLSETGAAATATLTIVATVTAPGALVHTATVTAQTEVDPNAANNSASVTLNAAESANLTVTKALTRSSPHVGELLTFNVIVANQGPSPATGVQVTEVLSAGLAFESATPSQGAYDPATGLWTVGSLGNGWSAGLTITARVTQAGTVTNTASVTSDQPDPDPSDNTSSVTLTTETIADLAVTKTLTGSSVPGRATAYAIVVTNLGPSPVTAVSVNDVFPVALVAPAWTCTADPGSSCAAAAGTGTLATTVTLEAGDRATFIVTGLIAANATGLLVNTATVTAPVGAVDGDATNNTATSSVMLTPSANLHITKEGPLSAVAGTNVIYTITVTNAGPSDAASVTLADPTPLGLAFVSNAGDCTTAFPCNLGTLPPAATRTITATFAVPSGYTTPNPIVNTATVTSATPPAVPQSAITSTPVAAPVTDLRITKTNGVNGVVAGETTTYTITITNPLGPSDASGATVTDVFPTTLTGVTWTCTGTGGGACPTSGSGNINSSVTVPVGASVVFTATGTVNPAATGVLVNSAQALPPAGHANRTSAAATDSDPITARADLGITKTGPAAIVAGNPLAYTITVTNAGPSDAAGVVVSDTTPAGLVFVSNTGACTTAFPCALGVVPAGATRTITATFDVPITYPGPGPIVNVASVSSTTPDDTATNNTATVETTLNRNADVSMSKSVSPAAVLVGQPTTFTVVVTNQGPARVTGLVVQDLLPAGLSFVSASPSLGSYADATGAWTIGTLQNAQSATLTLAATVTVAGAIINRALVVAQDQPDPVASNNSAAAIVNGAANADVGVHTAVDQPAPSVGDTVTFTVTVANVGPSPATGVVVTDALPAGLTFVSATPSQGTYAAPAWTVGTLSETGPTATATLTIVATVTAPGALVHTATVTAQTEVDPNAANNSASVTLNAAESANLKVTKALTRSSPHVGELLTFNVIVTNQGPSPATGIAVTEVLSAGLAFESAAPSQGAYDAATGIWTVGSLGNGGSAGLTTTARVTQAGTVTNTASVTARDQPDPDPTDNTASVTVTTETVADLTITKTLTGSLVPGRVTTYSIVVTNLGPSPVISASVTDVFPVALVAPTWTCTADPGSSCAAASGTGNLATTVSLEAGDRATFLVNGLIAANATGLLVNTATVTAPAGAVDGNTTNNTATSSVTLTPSADLQITKAGPANAVAGTNVVYTITVTNAGPSDATGVTVGDPTPPGLTLVANAGDCTTAFPCDLGTMPRASTRTVTATFAIPAGYTTPNPIANTATVSSTTPDAAAGNNSATTNTPVGTPVTDLHITKTNGVNGVVAGRLTTYTITITNPLGPSDASGATVIDTFPAPLTGVTWTCAGTGGGTCVTGGSGHINAPVTVPVGATVVFTATGTVDPAASGELVNSAQVIPPAGHVNRTSAIATDRDAIRTEADVAITTTADQASIVAGNPLVYTITVINTGPSDAAGVVVKDATPTGLVFVSNAGACTTAFPCALGIMPAGASRTITATFTVPPDYSGPSPIANMTDVSSTTVDTNTTNNTATALTTLDRNADVEVTKTVPSSGVLVGDEILVTINALNHGPNPATGIEVTDSLPAGIDFVSASASQGAYDPATGAWSVGSLAVSETAQLVLTAKVTAPGVITNLAVKTGQNEPDPIVGNDSAAAGTTATPAADLEVDKEVDRHNALVGETLTFTVRAMNRGPSPATGVTIADGLPAGLSFVSAAASQGSYDTATGLWTVGALDWLAQATLTLVARVDQPGALVNNASMASQDQIDPNPINNSDAKSVNAAPAADLRVIKAVSDAAPGVGALVTYTIAVTNLGPNDATSADLSDVLPAGVAFVSARASQGTYDSGTGIWALGAVPATRTEILRLTGRIMEPGTKVNTAARQSSTPVDPNAANDAGTATLTSSVVADLSLTKTPSAPAAGAGTSFTWTVAVVNNGPSTALGASVTDSFPAPFTGVTWTCTASSGSRCTSPSGTGTIAATVDLLAGGSATFVATGLSAPVASSPVVNVATVAVAAGTTDPDLSNNSDTSAVGLVPLADVQVTQAGPSFLAPGTSGDYLIMIANVGPSRTASTTLLMPTPSDFVPVTVRGACSSLPCALGELAPGEAREVIATLSPPADYAGPPTLIVRAVAMSAPFDPRPENNAASVVTTVTQLADLSITKTGPTTAVPGQRVTYAVTVANAGPSAATGVTVDDPTPAGLTLVSMSGDCTTAFPCNLGTMAPGTTRTIAATYTVAGGTAAPPEITNAATVLSGISDPNPANNRATISTRIRSGAKCDIDGDGIDEIITGAGPLGGPHVRVLKVSSGTLTELASFFAYDPKFGGGVFVACGDVTGDGIAEVITGAGPDGGPNVRAFSLAGGTPTEVASFFAYDPAFTGGVTVAAADLTGDGVAEIITGAGPGGGPHVRAFSLAGGTPTEVASFFAYDPAFTGGVTVAAADLTGDGVAEIITGAGPGAGPHVRAFNLAGGTPVEVTSFFAYDPAFTGGVTVAAADLTGDGVAEIITGAGPGAGPHVRAFNLAGGTPIEVTSFFAYDPAFTGGVTVAAADLTGDGVAEIITGAGPGGGPHVRAFSLADGTPVEVASFFAYNPAFTGGVTVAAADLTGDGVAEIITGAGPGGGPHVRAFSFAGGVVTEVASFFAYDPAFHGGVTVVAADLNRILPGVLPGFLSRLALAILRPPEPHDEAGAQHGTVAADVVRNGLRADGRPDDLILPREEVGAGAKVGRVAICAEETTIVMLFRPPVARDVPASAGRAPLARAGWRQSTVEQRPHQARRARAPPYAGTAFSVASFVT